MLRIVFVLAGAVLAFDGAHALVAQGECVQSCEDDGPDGTCPPDCADCSCCAHQTPLVAHSFTLTPSSEPKVSCASFDGDELPASADPRELQHIPKSLLG